MRSGLTPTGTVWINDAANAVAYTPVEDMASAAIRASLYARMEMPARPRDVATIAPPFRPANAEHEGRAVRSDCANNVPPPEHVPAPVGRAAASYSASQNTRDARRSACQLARCAGRGDAVTRRSSN